MILHMAIFQWKEEVTSADVEGVTAALIEMAAGLPELKGYRAGANLGLRPGGGDYGVAALVEDGAALDAYMDSEAHKAVYAKWLGEMIADRTAVQIAVADDAVI